MKTTFPMWKKLQAMQNISLCHSVNSKRTLNQFTYKCFEYWDIKVNIGIKQKLKKVEINNSNKYSKQSIPVGRLDSY